MSVNFLLQQELPSVAGDPPRAQELSQVDWGTGSPHEDERGVLVKVFCSYNSAVNFNVHVHNWVHPHKSPGQRAPALRWKLPI